MTIIGETGPTCGGKDEISKYLQSLGYISVSLSDYLRSVLRKEAKEKGLDLDDREIVAAEKLIELGNSLRAQYHPGIVAELAATSLFELGKNYVAGSIRNPAEVRAIRSKRTDFFLISVDASPEERLRRMIARGRTADEPKTLEELKVFDARQNSLNPNEQQINACMAMADFRIDTSGIYGWEEVRYKLYPKVDAVLDQIRRRTEPRPHIVENW